MRPCSPSFTCGLILSFALIAAGHVEPTLPYQEWALNRTIAASNEGPMAAVVNRNATARNATLELVRYFDTVGAAMKEEVANANYARTALRSICNASNHVASTAITFRMRTLQLGRWQSDCITELRLQNVENLWQNIATMQDTLEGSGRRLVEQTGVGARWTGGPFTHYAFNYSSALQTCEIRHVAAFRARGVWAVLGSLTSHPTNRRRIDRGRHYLEEYLTNKNGSVGNLQLAVNNSDLVRVNATTTQSTWGGVPAASIFLEVIKLENNPAIEAAMRTGSRFLEQAEDSKTAANIAIMILSCSLALVPIALFADVGTITALVYTIVTDIVSCLPLAIKGIELIQLSATTIAESSTLVYGLDSELDLGVAEVWVAKCTTRMMLRRLGIGFLAVALATMVVGLVLEIYCRARLKGMKQEYELFRTAEKNVALKNLWAREQRCPECNCYAVAMTSCTGDQKKDLLNDGILSTRLRKRRTLDLEEEIVLSHHDDDSIQPTRDSV